MVMTTQENQVVDRGRPTVGPVHDVVSVDEPPVHTAWEATLAIAPFERPADCRRNDAGFAADIERLTIARLDHPHDGRIATNPPDGFGGHDRPILDLRWVLGIDRAKFRQRFS